MSEDTWEARMAARAREREEKRRETADATLQALLPDNDAWLNGWPHDATTVRMGTAIHCIACGRIHGIVCTVFPPDWEPPGPEPDWPYAQDNCPNADCADWAPTYTRTSFDGLIRVEQR